MGMGIAALMTGAGAGQGLQELLKQRLLEREMALREQTQRENAAYRNRELDLRASEGEDARALREAIAGQNAYYQEGQLVDRAASNTPYDQELDVPTAVKFRAFGQPVTGPSLEQRVSPLANEALPPYRFRGNAPEPKPTKLLSPEEYQQQVSLAGDLAKAKAQNEPASSADVGTWSDTGRVNDKGEAIYVNTKTMQTRTMPFGAKPSAGSAQEADRKRLVVVDATNRTLDAIDELIDEQGTLRPEVLPAIGASRMSGVQLVPGTDAYNAQAAIDRLRARLVTDLMAELKAQSRTGATGFGQLNAQELKVMQDSAAKLNPGQTEQAFQAELQKIRRRLQMILQDGPSQSGGRFEILR